MKIDLNRIETRLQSFIENTATLLFPNSKQTQDLASALIETMQERSRTDQEGRKIAPNLYTLVIPEEQLDFWKQNEAYLDKLAEMLQDVASENDLTFAHSPVIRVRGESGLQPDGYRFQIDAHHSADGLAQTSTMASVSEYQTENTPANAFLIVDGAQIFPISSPTVTIGRRPDNQLVIQDPRVSRVHAQIRVIGWQIALFDLDSSGGTFVNGKRIQQALLSPGDVISLAGVPLVFGQDYRETEETQELLPPPSS